MSVPRKRTAENSFFPRNASAALPVPNKRKEEETELTERIEAKRCLRAGNKLQQQRGRYISGERQEKHREQIRNAAPLTPLRAAVHSALLPASRAAKSSKYTLPLKVAAARLRFALHFNPRFPGFGVPA